MNALETAAWYDRYEQDKGADRNDVLRNPGVLFQLLAWERSLVLAIAATRLAPESTRVLDVGCGDGGCVGPLLGMGFCAANITGVDILPERVRLASERFPGCRFLAGDARTLPFAAEDFSICLESTMFIQLTDDVLEREIASEMLRVTKPGGCIVLCDWRFGKPANKDYRGLGSRRLTRLFDVGSRTRLEGCFPGSIVPPVGRWLSAYAPSVYFLAGALSPLLVGQVSYVLRKL